MGELVDLDAFRRKRQQEAAAESPFAEKGMGAPSLAEEAALASLTTGVHQAQWEGALSELRDAGNSLMHHLVRTLILVSQQDENGRVPISLHVYEELVAKGMPRESAVYANWGGPTQQVRVSTANLEAVAKIYEAEVS